MKLGFLVNNLGPSQLSYFLIRNTNLALAERAELDAVVFYETMTRPCLSPCFATMQLPEAFAFDGVAIATSLAGAARLLHFAGTSKKFLYVWDLEWIRMQQKDFASLRSIYGNQELTLLARSADHKKLLEDSWNRPVKAVVDDFCMRSILEAVND